ncbi:hypothetical protein ACLOJK_021123 [Asimina triloba]
MQNPSRHAEPVTTDDRCPFFSNAGQPFRPSQQPPHPPATRASIHRRRQICHRPTPLPSRSSGINTRARAASSPTSHLHRPLHHPASTDGTTIPSLQPSRSTDLHNSGPPSAADPTAGVFHSTIRHPDRPASITPKPSPNHLRQRDPMASIPSPTTHPRSSGQAPTLRRRHDHTQHQWPTSTHHAQTHPLLATIQPHLATHHRSVVFQRPGSIAHAHDDPRLTPPSQIARSVQPAPIFLPCSTTHGTLSTILKQYQWPTIVSGRYLVFVKFNYKRRRREAHRGRERRARRQKGVDGQRGGDPDLGSKREACRRPERRSGAA